MHNKPSMPKLNVGAIKATPVEVPLAHALGTSRQLLDKVPLLLIDLETEQGVTGRSWLFCYLRAAMPGIIAILGEVETATKGERVAPEALWARLARRFTLIGVQGIVRMALAGFDVAAWDALAIAAGKPLTRFLGAEPRPIPAYNSCGLGLKDDLGVLAAEADELMQRGFTAVKLRLGYATAADDIAAVRAVRKRIGHKALLMVDYNQALSLDDALERGRALDGENIYWLEEPIRHDDYAGTARLVREVKTPIQIGENFSLPEGMVTALEQAKPQYVMPDLERIGGVTGWLQAAKLAAVNRVPMSSHLFSEVSAHLLTATPTCHFLEYMDWADAVLREPLVIADGHALVPERPGNGMVWNEDAVNRYRI